MNRSASEGWEVSAASGHANEIAEGVASMLRGFHDWARDRGALTSAADVPRLRAELRRLQGRLQGGFFLGGDRYAGHMRTEPMLPAILAGMLGDLYGINMLVDEQSLAARAIERETIGDLASLVGMPQGGGRFTAGGTISNIEAMYVALRACIFPHATRALAEGVGVDQPASRKPRETLAYARELVKALTARLGDEAYVRIAEACEDAAATRDLVVLSAGNAHYSARKAVRIVGGGVVRTVSVDVTPEFRMDARDLRAKLAEVERRGARVVAVFTTAGSTATGSVDPLDAVAELQDEHGFWWHVDAAYGGYFRTLLRGEAGPVDPRSELAREELLALAAMGRATSVSVDPHKLGYLPPGTGALLFEDPAYGAFVEQGAGYFRDDDAHGLQLDARACSFSGIEGSRSARGALACHVMHRLLPLDRTGHGALLASTVRACRDAFDTLLRLRFGPYRLLALHEPQLNIFCLTIGRVGGDLAEANRVTALVGDAIRAAGSLYCTRNTFHPEDNGALLRDVIPSMGLTNEGGAREVESLRFVFSNPQSRAFDVEAFERAVRDALGEESSSLPLAQIG
jgi:glutamate/tyrosine decarboxylase-like PLP-dependent enzyme